MNALLLQQCGSLVNFGDKNFIYGSMVFLPMIMWNFYYFVPLNQRL